MKVTCLFRASGLTDLIFLSLFALDRVEGKFEVSDAGISFGKVVPALPSNDGGLQSSKDPSLRLTPTFRISHIDEQPRSRVEQSLLKYTVLILRRRYW